MAEPLPENDTLIQNQERRRLRFVVAGILGLIVLPIVLSLILSNVDLSGSDTPKLAKPEWVSLPQLRVTTADGSGVKARVALDVQDSAAKLAIQTRVQQVTLLLEVTVAAQGREKIQSPQGLQQLPIALRDRLNGYLAAEGMEPAVRSVAIQDLVISRP